VVFADRNAPALGGILNQQGVGNSTMWEVMSQQYSTIER